MRMSRARASLLARAGEEKKGTPGWCHGVPLKSCQKRNRRASNALSPVLIHFVAPHGKLFQRLLALEQLLGSIPPLLTSQQYAGPQEPHYGIAPEEWPNVVRRVMEHHDSLRQVAADYGVSHETVRRILRAS